MADSKTEIEFAGVKFRGGKMLIIITAPFIPLLSQWKEEVQKFNVTPIYLDPSIYGNASNRIKKLNEIINRINLNNELVVVIMSNDFFKESKVHNILKTLKLVISRASDVHLSLFLH